MVAAPPVLQVRVPVGRRRRGEHSKGNQRQSEAIRFGYPWGSGAVVSTCMLRDGWVPEVMRGTRKAISGSSRYIELEPICSNPSTGSAKAYSAVA